MTDDASPARPSLEQAPSRPDALARLRRWLKDLPHDYVGLRETMADAIDVIEGLRQSNAWRLGEINRLKAELADARQEEGR